MNQVLRGMTLVELLATIAILGIVTIFAIPSFRGLQGRQDLRVTQSTIQSGLYRLQQLAVAPPVVADATGQPVPYDVVGYGLVFLSIPKVNYAGSVSLTGCTVTVTNDFLATIKFVRPKSGNSDITPYLAAVDPAASGTCQVEARNFPQDFYVLPQRVKLATLASKPVLSQPWLITRPLASVGRSVGRLDGGGSFINPFDSSAMPQLAVQHTSIRQNGEPICYAVTLSQASEAIEITNRVTQGCSDA